MGVGIQRCSKLNVMVHVPNMAVYMEKYCDEIPTISKIVRDVSGNPHTVEVEWWYGR